MPLKPISPELKRVLEKHNIEFENVYDICFSHVMALLRMLHVDTTELEIDQDFTEDIVAVFKEFKKQKKSIDEIIVSEILFKIKVVANHILFKTEGIDFKHSKIASLSNEELTMLISSTLKSISKLLKQKSYVNSTFEDTKQETRTSNQTKKSSTTPSYTHHKDDTHKFEKYRFQCVKTLEKYIIRIQLDAKSPLSIITEFFAKLQPLSLSNQELVQYTASFTKILSYFEYSTHTEIENARDLWYIINFELPHDGSVFQNAKELNEWLYSQISKLLYTEILFPSVQRINPSLAMYIKSISSFHLDF